MNPPTKLVLVCVECGKVQHAPLLGDNMRIAPRRLYLECKMLLSVASPPGAGEILLAPVCVEPCAVKGLGRELVDLAIKKFLGEN